MVYNYSDLEDMEFTYESSRFIFCTCLTILGGVVIYNIMSCM